MTETRIVVLQRGWVVVGHFTSSGEMCRLDNAAVIRTWGTTHGLGELREGPTKSTVLDPCGTVEFHVLTSILILTCDSAAWKKVLK